MIKRNKTRTMIRELWREQRYFREHQKGFYEQVTFELNDGKEPARRRLEKRAIQEEGTANANVLGQE